MTRFLPHTPPGVLVVCAVVFGCSGRDLPETVPVTGKVLHEGKPLADAEVGFVPKQDASGAHPAHGRTDESGVFTLKTYFGPQDEVSGATPGEYIVTVQKRDIPPDPAELQKMFQKSPQMIPKSLLPDRYASPTTSNLEATVEAGEDNTLEFKLDD